ncbi:MAG: EGF domain-containing protein [Plesiomonas sp.]
MVTGGLPEQNPCFTGRHGCDINAVCRPGEGLQFACDCTDGFAGDGRYCHGNPRLLAPHSFSLFSGGSC